MTQSPNIKNLIELSTLDIEKIPLEEIAFLISREKYFDLNPQPYLERLDEFARRAELRIGKVMGGRQLAQGLSQYLFEEEGFRGNTTDYYNPSNSYFNDVLDRREGIPISLSILYIAIGRRLGLPLVGVGFPGHFLVRYEDANVLFFIDCFHHGRILSDEECRRRLEDMYGEALVFQKEFLEPSGHREILLRMLTNLKMIYMMKKDFGMSLQFLNRILLFNPYGFEEIKERGIIHYHMECFGSALKDLEAYLRSRPKAADRHVIEECIEDLRVRVSQIQ